MDLQTAAVANRFILMSRGPITIMRLVKLMYFAQGWHLAHTDSPLFSEEIQAWQYGPVVPSIYHEAKYFGSAPIDRFLMAGVPANALSEYGQYLIDWLDAHYANTSTAKLADETHQRGTPWHQTYDGSRNRVIPRHLMRDWFRAQLERKTG